MGAAKSIVSGEIARWVTGFTGDQAPINARHEAYRSLLDVVGVSMAGQAMRYAARSAAFQKQSTGLETARCLVPPDADRR